MRVARNRAIDLIRRDNQFRYLIPELTYLLKLREENTGGESASEKEIQDDQLRMMFSCCHPGLSTEVQVTFILKTLCGFSVAEIASALLAGEESIEKRLGRARKLFRESGTFVGVTDASDIPGRLEAVYRAVYLLFNEGYHGSQSERTIREDLCYEVLRLALLLSEHPQGARPKTFALLALFCFNAARLPGRVDAEGFLIQLENQDRSKWDRALIGKGFHFLGKSASENELSEFHLEAAIAVGQAQGPEKGLVELEKIPDLSKLKDYPFYPAAQREFHRLAGRREEARVCFERALKLARNPSETRFLERKLRAGISDAVTGLRPQGAVHKQRP